MVNNRTAAAIVAGIVMIVGLVLGTGSVKVDGVACGSALGGTAGGSISEARLADYGAQMREAMNPYLPAARAGESVEARCGSSLGGRQAITWTLLGAGALGLVALGLTRRPRPVTTEP